MDTQAEQLVIPDDIARTWERIVDTISDVLSVPSVMINHLEPPELAVFRANVGADNPFPSGTRMPLAGVYCETAARRRQMVKVVDARTDPEWSDSPTAKAGIFAYLGYPLFWPEGDVFGTLCMIDTKANKWGQRYENLIFAFKGAIEAHLSVVRTLKQLDQKNRELQTALDEVKTLHGLLPICACCKKIRDDKGYWNQIEIYIKDHADVRFSHGYCPDCLAQEMAKL